MIKITFFNRKILLNQIVITVISPTTLLLQHDSCLFRRIRKLASIHRFMCHHNFLYPILLINPISDFDIMP